MALEFVFYYYHDARGTMVCENLERNYQWLIGNCMGANMITCT